jgi:hypothetical protein
MFNWEAQAQIPHGFMPNSGKPTRSLDNFVFTAMSCFAERLVLSRASNPRRNEMPKSRPQPPRPDRRRSIRGSFSWIDHRFLREGFDQGLTRLEKLFYFILVAVSNKDGVSFYSDARLAELLDIRFPHELDGARKELVARDLIAYESGIYQVLDLPASSPRKARDSSAPLPDHAGRSSSSLPRVRRIALRDAASDLESVKRLLEQWGWGRS